MNPLLSNQPRHTRLVGGLFALLLASFLLLIYWPGLQGGFFFDDEANILIPDGVRMTQFSVETLRLAMTSGHAGFSGRSVAQLSFALNYYLSGFEPFAFKATNLALHATNGILVFLLAWQLLARCMPQLRGFALPIAAVSTVALWVLHPIQLTSVLLVVQRMTMLSALFLLSAFLLHINARERQGGAALWRFFIAWVVFWPLSFFSKETGALFPFFVLTWELIARRATVGHIDLFARCLAVSLAVLSVLIFAYSLSDGGQWLWSGYQFRSFSMLQRLMTEGRVLFFYLGLIFFPSLERLGLHHDDLLVSSTLIVPWTTLPALAGFVGLLGLCGYSYRKMPLVSFGVAWFLIGHALESTVFPLELAHEHRNYLPSFGIMLAVVSALVPLFEKSGVRKTLGLSMVGLCVAYFSVVTALRAQQFGDDLLRTQIEAQHHRGSARAQYDAGQVLSRLAASAPKNAPIHGVARKHFELSMELDPDFKIGGLGLLYLDCLRGGEVERRWLDELSARLKNSAFSPGDTSFLHGLKEMAIGGDLCLEGEDVNTLFDAAIANPRIDAGTLAKLHSWHADYLWLASKDLPASLDAIRESLRLAPSNPSYQLKYAQLLLLSGNDDQGQQLLRALRGAKLSLAEQQKLDGLLVLGSSVDKAGNEPALRK